MIGYSTPSKSRTRPDLAGSADRASIAVGRELIAPSLGERPASRSVGGWVSNNQRVSFVLMLVAVLAWTWRT